MKNKTIDVLKMLRVNQWVKNIFVYVGMIVARKTINLKFFRDESIMFILFCGISSAVYIFNDLVDLEKDMLHPIKKNRPLAAGRIKKEIGLVVGICLALICLLQAYFFNKNAFLILNMYLLLNVAYSIKLKNYVIIDICIIAAGFILRILSGIVISGADISYWLLLSMALLMVFLGFNKRKRELLVLNENSGLHKKSLEHYSHEFINECTPMLTACSIITYVFYIIYDAKEVLLCITVPVFIYGILRYQYLISSMGYGENPEKALMKDKVMLFTGILWAIIFVKF